MVGVAKTVLRGKFTVLDSYIRKIGLKSINLSFYFKKSEKERKLNTKQTEKGNSKN